MGLDNRQVVILAGGKGTRLRPLTYRIPKPMVPIRGKSFLHYQLEFIKSFNINEVLLLVGHLGRQIEEYFGDGSEFELNIEYSYEEIPMGTGGALKNAKDKLKKEFLLLNGDTYLPIDYNKLIKYFRQSNKVGVITVYDNAERIVPNNIFLAESNLVLDYNKKDSKGMNYVDAGVIAFRKDILDFIPQDQEYSLEKDVFPQLIKKKQLLAFPTSQRFYDMGSFQGLKLLEQILK